MPKSLVRLAYRSVSQLHPDDAASLDAIFRTSIKNNKRDRITGWLAHPDGHFVQVLEGRPKVVDDLMGRLRADGRHANMIVLGEWIVPGRLFTDWAMARPDRRPLSEQEFRIINETDSASQITGIFLNLVQDRRLFFSLS